MKIKNIDDLKKNINRSTILIFFIIFSAAFIGLHITHSKFLQKRFLLNKQEISFAINSYKSNLSEKLSIIASSNVFLDYLRSGDVTRKKLHPQFLSQIASLKAKSIIGMQIMDLNNNIIFNYGNKSTNFVILKLCYLNQTLDAEMGSCNYQWRLNFNPAVLLHEILLINRSIRSCEKCIPYQFFKEEFGSFFIQNHSDFILHLEIRENKDYFFYIYLLLITLTLSMFGTWSWYRLNSLLNHYITYPIKNLAECLKTNLIAKEKDNLDEIQYLINEINQWKEKLNKVKSDENAIKLGKVIAQVAHDVRSPLAAIDMIMKHLHYVPEKHRVILQKATERISNIANNLLLQYKMPSIECYSIEHIPTLLESIITEKNCQFLDENIIIQLQIQPESWDAFAKINADDFKRIISNIINNSVEAISTDKAIFVTLTKTKNFIVIKIIDKGFGIRSELISEIEKGGLSLGKDNGFGLGISHAIDTLKNWDGSFNIQSKINEGTIVKITLPIHLEIPQWFKLSLSLKSSCQIFILDDEIYIHNLWSERFQQFGITVNHAHSLAELLSFIKLENKENLYLIDYDIGINQSNGIEIITQLNLESSAILVTNSYDDKILQATCIKHKIQIIPKNYVPFIPINIFQH